MCVPTSSFVSRESIRRQASSPRSASASRWRTSLRRRVRPGIVEREADVILDDPQPLAGAVGRGVEDPRQVDAAPGLGQVQGGDLRGHRDRPGLHQRRPRRGARATAGAPGRRHGAARRPGRRRPSGRPAGARCRPRATDPARGPGSSPRSGPAARSADRGNGSDALRDSSSASASIPPTHAGAQGLPEPVSVDTPNSASSSAARLSTSSASAASRSSGSTSAAPRRRATDRLASRPAPLPPCTTRTSAR